MKVKEFNTLYNNAMVEKNIVESEMFNTMVWIWFDLTKKQHEKMYNLMLLQGVKEEVEEFTNRNYIKFKSGLIVYKE